MSEQERLMRRINAYQFALWELHIYLDTHPNDCKAAEKHEEYSKMLAELTAEYESKFGPIHENPHTANRWAWIASPWPWENTEEGR